MDLFDFFFPEQAQATHLREIAKNSGVAQKASAHSVSQESEIAGLKNDLHFLTLVLAAVLKRLTETETMNLADVQDLLEEIDKMDGIDDRNLDPDFLRGILGILKKDSDEDKSASRDEFRIDTIGRFRR